MSAKEKSVVLIVTGVLIGSTIVIIRLSSDALGVMLGTCMGISAAVPMLAAVAWAVRRSHEDQYAHYVRQQEEFLDALRARERQMLLDAVCRRDVQVYRDALRYRQSIAASLNAPVPEDRDVSSCGDAHR